MIRQQIAALRKQLDEVETAPFMLGYTPQGPMAIVHREFQLPSQVHDNQIPENNGTAGFESYKWDIQNRAKAAVAHGRSFIA